MESDAETRSGSATAETPVNGHKLDVDLVRWIPPEIWQHILSFLSLRDRLRARIVCREFDRIARSIPFTAKSLHISRPIRDTGLIRLLEMVGLRPCPPHCSALFIGDWNCSCAGEENIVLCCSCRFLSSLGLTEALMKAHRNLTTLALSALPCMDDNVVKTASEFFTGLKHVSVSGCCAIR